LNIHIFKLNLHQPTTPNLFIGQGGGEKKPSWDQVCAGGTKQPRRPSGIANCLPQGGKGLLAGLKRSRDQARRGAVRNDHGGQSHGTARRALVAPPGHPNILRALSSLSQPKGGRRGGGGGFVVKWQLGESSPSFPIRIGAVEIEL
jgi:hypothetical protein